MYFRSIIILYSEVRNKNTTHSTAQVKLMQMDSWFCAYKSVIIGDTGSVLTPTWLLNCRGLATWSSSCIDYRLATDILLQVINFTCLQSSNCLPCFSILPLIVLIRDVNGARAGNISPPRLGPATSIFSQSPSLHIPMVPPCISPWSHEYT